MINTPHSNSKGPIKHPVSLESFLSAEESKLLDLISKSSLSEDKKFELEYIVVPSVREVVGKILMGYLGYESDLRVLGDPTILPKVLSDIEQEDGWNSLGSMKRRMVVRGVKWKEEMEEGMMELVREKIREMYSLEEWMNLTVPEKGGIKITIGGKEKGLIELATLLRTGGNPVTITKDMQNMLKKIYSPEEFQEYHQGVREKIRAKHSLEEWMNLKKLGRQTVKIVIGGKKKGLIALAGSSFFNINGNPVEVDDSMQNFLRRIYTQEEFQEYHQGVREKIRAKHSLEEWMNLKKSEKTALNIVVGGKERGLMTLAGVSFFNTGGNPAQVDDSMQNLLKQIYTQEEFQEYHQGVREKIRAKHSLEEWMNLTPKERLVVKIMIGGKEKGLTALVGTSFFNIKGNPMNDNVMQNLLKQIYTQEEFQEYHQGVKEKMRAKYTLEEWMNLTQPEKGVVKITIGGKEKGLMVLAGVKFLGTGGRPVNKSTDFKNLMIAIYGAEEVEKYSHLLRANTGSKK